MQDTPTLPSLVDLAARIRTEHEKACRSARATVESALRVGDLLLEAKKLVDHGGWIEWLEHHCDLSRRTAETYMRLARNRPNAQLSAHLTIEATLKALARSKPDQPTSIIPVNEPAGSTTDLKQAAEAVIVATNPAKAPSVGKAAPPSRPVPHAPQGSDLISQCVLDVRARIVDAIDQLDPRDWSLLAQRLHEAIDDLLDQPAPSAIAKQQKIDDLDIPEFLRRRAP
jgi:hypothetical protein